MISSPEHLGTTMRYFDLSMGGSAGDLEWKQTEDEISKPSQHLVKVELKVANLLHLRAVRGKGIFPLCQMWLYSHV